MKRFQAYIIVLFLVMPFLVHADSGDLTIQMDPQNPAPYDKVTLRLVSYSVDVDNSMITWASGGKNISQGVGTKTLTVQTRGVGQDIPITVSVASVGGGKITASIDIIPQSVDLIWETPESYVPPFYEGKSLPGEGADVKVTAIPSISVNGAQIPANNLSYSWYVNGELVDSASGQGRSTAVLGLDYLSTKTDIKVSVRSANGSVAEKTITIYPHAVLPLVYTYDDILGTNFSQQIIRRLETAKDITLSLVPFFLSSRNELDQDVSYSWFLDNQSVTPPEKTLLALHPEPNSYGSKSLKILISNAKRNLQNTEVNLDVIFDSRN